MWVEKDPNNNSKGELAMKLIFKTRTHEISGKKDYGRFRQKNTVVMNEIEEQLNKRGFDFTSGFASYYVSRGNGMVLPGAKRLSYLNDSQNIAIAFLRAKDEPTSYNQKCRVVIQVIMELSSDYDERLGYYSYYKHFEKVKHGKEISEFTEDMELKKDSSFIINITEEDHEIDTDKVVTNVVNIMNALKRYNKKKAMQKNMNQMTNDAIKVLFSDIKEAHEKEGVNIVDNKLVLGKSYNDDVVCLYSDSIYLKPGQSSDDISFMNVNHETFLEDLKEYVETAIKLKILKRKILAKKEA